MPCIVNMVTLLSLVFTTAPSGVCYFIGKDTRDQSGHITYPVSQLGSVQPGL